MKKMKIEKIMTKKILILTLSLLTINLVSKAQVELISSGTGSAYTLTVPGVFSLRNGIQVTFKAHANSSAAATINVSGSGALSIMKDGGTNALSASDIKAGQIVTLVFDGSNWQMMNPVATPPAAPTTYWSPNGSDIYNNNGGNVTVNADNSDGAYKMAIGKNASSVEKVLALTNTNNFVGGGTTFGFRSNFGGTLWDQALISGITGALSASGDLAFSVMQNRGTSTMIEAMRIKGNTGRIGIMTPNPDRTLHVLGDGLKIENAGTNLEIYPNGNEFMISTTKQYLSFAGNGGATAMYMDDGNITVNLPLTIQDGSQASGRVLASDASGNASWTDLSALSSGSTAWTKSGTLIYPTDYSNDNVGIGTNNPLTKLHVLRTLGSADPLVTVMNGHAGGHATIRLSGGATHYSIGSDPTTGTFRIANSSTGLGTNDRFTIDNTGNIGIGTTTPTTTSKLHVKFTSSGNNENLRLENTVTNTGFGFVLQNPNQQWEMGMNVGNYSDDRFQLFNISNSTAVMTVLPTGLVGIGAPSPATILDVANSSLVTTSRFSNTLSSGTQKMAVYGWATGTGAGANLAGAFEATGSTSTNYGVQGNAFGNSGAKIGVYGSAIGTGTNTAGYFTATGGTSNYAIVVPSGGGNVGIGTSTPSEKLEVVGNIEIPAANDYMYASAKTNYSSISPVAFIPESSTYFRNSVSGYVHLSGGTFPSTGEIHAPVYLPNGAYITEIRFYLYDNDATYDFIYLQLFRYTMTSGASSFSSVTIPTGTYALSSYATTPNWTVDNSIYQYMLRIGLPQNSTNHRIYGVRITYTVTNAD